MGVSPIDFVVPMVFHQDPEWQRSFEKIGSWFDESDPRHFVRYRSWGNEELQIKAVRKYMPWVRTIYILLAQESQKQAWMDKEGVRVVYHKDFIPEKYLPLFNSQSIEMFLKDIPDLSERFIYANDDMFPLGALKEDDFYRNGRPCIEFRIKDFPVIRNTFHKGCLNGLNFVAKKFGKAYEKNWVSPIHGFIPMLKSTWEYLWKIGEKEILNSISPFREPKNFNQYIYSQWHYLSGEYVARIPDTVYVNTENSTELIKQIIMRTKVKILCINDNECLNDYEPFAKAVNEALRENIDR